MIYKVPIKHKEETPTQALTKDIQNNLSVIKDDIVASSQENVINGENLDDFIYHHFLNRIDPVEYCENVLRHHLPESRQKLHENQTALIRAVCNPKLKQVAGMMSRQCLLRGTIIHTRDGKLIPIEEYKDAWKTNDNASIFEIHVKGGHIIKCTGNHPIKTQNGWKRADELTKQDWVLCLDYWDKFGNGKIPYHYETYVNIHSNNKIHNGIFEMNDELAELVGFITSDGYFKNPRQSCKFTNINQHYLARVKYIVEKYFPDIHIKEYKNGKGSQLLFTTGKKDNKNSFKDFIRILNYDENRIPRALNYFTKSQLCAFFRGMWCGDGWISKKTKRNKLSYEMGLSGKTSWEYAQFLRENLNKLGIRGSIKQEWFKKSTQWFYRISIGGQRNRINFINTIGDILDKPMPDIKYAKGCNPLKTEKGLDGEHLYYSPFVSRKEIGTGEVWDVEFPNKGWFIAGGMVVHNSGKCFAKGTKILMEDGSKKNVEDIKVGDYVMSPTSEPRLITNLGHGYEDMFEIIPNDIGYEPFTVNASHIISLIDKKNNIFNIEIKDYLKLPLQERKTLFGYRANINYQYIAFDFNVYNLGKILSNKEKNVFDKNIQDYINHHTNNDILYDIKINSLETRLLFLSGFVDGKSSTIGKDKIKLKIDDFNFACEMLDLIRSVGMKANLKQNKKTNSIYFFGRFSLLSSVKTKNLSDNNFSLIFKFKVKPKGIGEYFGFTIDSPDHLFLLGDYTVTHNTESISSFCGFLIDNYPQMRVGVFTPRLQQAEVSIGRLSTFFQMNEDRLNNKIVKLTKDRIELSNKSYVTAVSASDQSNIEGLTFDVIVLDEAQKVSDYTFSERIVPMGN